MEERQRANEKRDAAVDRKFDDVAATIAREIGNVRNDIQKGFSDLAMDNTVRDDERAKHGKRIGDLEKSRDNLVLGSRIVTGMVLGLGGLTLWGAKIADAMNGIFGQPGK